jgi:maltose alpha-D-glucosyltransferase/alpha-amylase
VEAGTNPDLEIRQFLGQHDFPHMPRLAGSLEYQRKNREKFTVALVTQFVPESKSGWEFTMDALGRYLDRTGALAHEGDGGPPAIPLPADSQANGVPEEVTKLIGTYLESSRLLGQRTAQMHLALASDPDNPAFAPEAFTPFYQRSLYQSMRNLTVQTLQMLRRGTARLAEPVRNLAETVAGREADILKCFRTVYETKMSAKRIRCHGDLHLGEVLHTGKDFIFVDFEGDAGRPLGERRIKRSALRDIASMIRSFDYVSYAALFRQVELGILREDRLPQLEPWRAFWHQWVSSAFARAYAQTMRENDLLPHSRPEMMVLLKVHLLEKAIHEVAYELRYRPNWATIPFRAILDLVTEWVPAK